jgi:hypothetical protein
MYQFTDVPEQEEVLARIEELSIAPGLYNKDQVTLKIRPLDRVVGGTTGLWSSFLNTPTSAASFPNTWTGKLMIGLEKFTGRKLSPMTFREAVEATAQEWVGKVVWFSVNRVAYTTKDKKEKSSSYFVPIKVGTEEDIAAAQTRMSQAQVATPNVLQELLESGANPDEWVGKTIAEVIEIALKSTNPAYRGYAQTAKATKNPNSFATQFALELDADGKVV